LLPSQDLSFKHDPSQPLFRTTTGPFKKEFIIDYVENLLLRISVDAPGVSGHSFSKGAAVAAKGKWELVGRRKSNAVDLYINEVDEATHIHNILGLVA
jgi:hypothetical protein